MKPLFSIHARLLLAALATTLVALTATGWLLRREIVHVIAQNLSAKIDTQVWMIERGVGPDGRPQPGRTQFLADINTPEERWGWRLRTEAGLWAGGIPFGQVHPWAEFLEPRTGVINGRAKAADGSPLYVRMLPRPGGSIEVAVPMERLDETLRPAMHTMLVALAGLAAVLIAATLLQLRYGLRPLQTLRDDLARVRDGEAKAVTTTQPRELLPLAEEVNALLAQNAAGLAHARNHVANLAHGLKTPLATLALVLARDGEDARARALTLVADLDGRIDHHLGRARAAAISAGTRARTDAAEVVATLVPALRQLHASRGIATETAVPSVLVGVDRQDLDEILGNLLDNACRHARSRVRITGSRGAGFVHLCIEDDGPGIADAALATAMQAGTRLDEIGRGYGFGLGIAQELSELYGGRLTLARSPGLSGLAATLVLPVR